MGERRYHILKANTSTARPTDHLFVDIESRLEPQDDNTTIHRLWFGWCCYWQRRGGGRSDTVKYQRFETVTEWWDIVEAHTQRKRTLHLVSHNVNYDFGVLDVFNELEARGFALTNIYLGGMTAIVTWKRGDEKILILDNANWFPTSLAALGESVGYEKLDVDPLTATLAEVDPYCRRDVEIIHKAWEAYYDFLDQHDLGKWGRTIPSQSFNAYRHRFMVRQIHIHNDAPTLCLERQSYHGGRTSVFRQGVLVDGPYYYVDVNSMYPYVMSAHPFPVRAHAIRTSPSVSHLRQALDKYQVIADVTINTTEPVFPVMRKGRAIHPVGLFRTTLSTPELRYAAENSSIVACHSLVRYTAATIFRDYVTEFYDLKRQYKAECNPTYYMMVKLFLNSLYGKFGQRAGGMEQIEDIDPAYCVSLRWINHDTGEVTTLYRFGSTYWIQTRGGEAYNSFPAIAAHVTAYARMLLWRLMKKAGDAHYFYCDTDSLIVDRVGYDRLADELHDDRLGALKVEHVADSVTIRAPKCYSFGPMTKRKGVPKKATQTGANRWEYDQFPSFRSQARWAKGVPFHTTRTHRTLTYDIADGTVGPDGWVTPLAMGDLAAEDGEKARRLISVTQKRAEVDALRSSIRVTAATVFAVWDHRKGTWRRGRNRDGELVPFEYSRWDDRATELGFSDLNELQEAVSEALNVWSRIRDIESAVRDTLRPVVAQAPVQELPF